MDLAQRLQTLRKHANYSQEQLAELLGISRQAVSKWESGQGKPEADNLVKLAELYPLSLLLSTLLQVAEALLARALWNDGRPGELMEACLTRFYPLVSQSEAQRFLFVALCLLAVLLFFGDGLPRRGGKQEDKG